MKLSPPPPSLPAQVRARAVVVGRARRQGRRPRRPRRGRRGRELPPRRAAHLRPARAPRDLSAARGPSPSRRRPPSAGVFAAPHVARGMSSDRVHIYLAPRPPISLSRSQVGCLCNNAEIELPPPARLSSRPTARPAARRPPHALVVRGQPAEIALLVAAAKSASPTRGGGAGTARSRRHHERVGGAVLVGARAGCAAAAASRSTCTSRACRGRAEHCAAYTALTATCL